MRTHSNKRWETGNEIISRAINNLNLTAEFDKHKIFFCWSNIVGKEMARYILPQKLEYKILYVYASSSAWANNFQYLKPEVISKINKFVDKDLVSEIVFTRFRKKREIDDSLLLEKKINLGKCLKQVPLSEEDNNNVDKLVDKIDDEDLRIKLKQVYLKGAKLNKLKQKYGWTSCVRCGRLTPGGAKYCSTCYRDIKQETADKIAEIFQAVPWARYQDVVKYVNCDPTMVNKQRDKLVQIAARNLLPDVDYPCNDKSIGYSKAAKHLVMLYKSIPPHKLTDIIVAETIYKLRYDTSYYNNRKKKWNDCYNKNHKP